jgi:hypothetical protein
MSTAVLLILIALVSSGALFVILKWIGVIGTEVAAEVESDDPTKTVR